MLVISSYLLIKEFLQYKRNNYINIKLADNVIIESNDEEKTKIDWQKLKSINRDIIGWIKIENTNINYPILQDNDELKYLRHSFNKEYNKNGSIFTLNNRPFEDKKTVLYGHNMKNETMFSELGKYMNKEFLDEHSTFEIFTENQNYKATIFSCYSISESEEKNNINLLEFKEEVEYYKKKSVYLVDNIDNIEKIVKLSTCSYLNNNTIPTNQRYCIVAKLEQME